MNVAVDSQRIISAWLALRSVAPVSHIESENDYGQATALLDDVLTDAQRDLYLGEANKILEHWDRPGIFNVVLTYVLPLSGPVIEGYRFMFPGQLPEWSGFLGVMLLTYTLGFVVAAHMVKRGIFLGLNGTASSFPGGVEGRGYYKEENRILSAAKISKRELPLDIILSFLGLSIGYLTLDILMKFYSSLGIEMPPQDNTGTQMIILWAIFIILWMLSIYRRKTLRRE